mgnify:CR=1 FL=1
MAILTPLQDVNAARRTAFDTHNRHTPAMFEAMGPTQISETVTHYTLQFESHTKSYRIKEASTDRYIRFTKDRDCIRVNGKLPLAAGTALQKHLIRSSILGGPYLIAADVNHDETVDIMDMIRLIQYVSDDAKITQED